MLRLTLLLYCGLQRILYIAIVFNPRTFCPKGMSTPLVRQVSRKTLRARAWPVHGE